MGETEEELDRRYEGARDELDALLAIPRHRAQVDAIRDKPEYAEKLVWLGTDPDTCERMNCWIKSGRLEAQVRQMVVHDRQAASDEAAALTASIDEAVARGVSWVFNK